jgi:hypothetical protein
MVATTPNPFDPTTVATIPTPALTQAKIGPKTEGSESPCCSFGRRVRVSPDGYYGRRPCWRREEIVVEGYRGGGVRLEFSGERAPLTDLADVNAALLSVGARLWPIDLRGIPDDIRGFLAKPTLDEKEVAAVREHFLLPRERLLELIEQAGRAPQVPGGGEMSTLDATNDATLSSTRSRPGWITCGSTASTRTLRVTALG